MSKNRTDRQKAAEARAAQIAAEKRRQRMVNIAAIVGVGIVVIAIIGGAWYYSQQTKKDTGAVVNPDAAVPAGAYGPEEPQAYGIPYGSNPEAPRLEVWEDFQCPACGQFEALAGESLRGLADEGTIVLATLPSTSPRPPISPPSSPRRACFGRRSGRRSRRSAAAYGCAVDAGVGTEYKATVFAAQPQREGDGWTDEQLLEFGTTAGVSEEDYPTFEACYNDRVYLGWAGNSTDAFYSDAIPGTPTVKLDGQEIAIEDVLNRKKQRDRFRRRYRRT